MRYWLAFMMGIVLVPVIVAGRTFTDRQGNSIDAEVFAVYGSWVFLEIEPNVTLHFDLRNLVESDLEYVVQWAIDYEPTRINRPLVKDSESALTQFLRSNLVKLSGNRLVNYDISEKREPEFYVFYSSASWCGPCRRFTPSLVSTYKSLREQGLDNFEFILIGSDQTNRKMQEYMVSSGMEWPAVRFNRRNDRMLRQFGGRGIPCVAVADRNGRVLFHSYRGQEYLGPMDPLEKFIQVVYLTQRVGQQRSDPASQQVPQ